MTSHVDTDAALALLTTGNLLRLVGLWALYRLSLALYNISPFHPLHRFPGPRLARMSLLYEFWFDFVLVGRYSMEIKRLHEIYGPIIRINPEELHCIDPEFYDEIYAGAGRIRDKQPHYLNTLTGPLVGSSFGTIDHETHRMRRNAVNKFFSRAQMIRLEPEVHVLAQKLCDKLLRSTKEPIQAAEAFNCFTADTISQYAYGENLGFLDQKGWKPNYKDAFDSFTSTMFYFRYFPVARYLAPLAPIISRYLPDGNATKLLMQEMTETIPGHIQAATIDRTHGRIFSDLLASSLPDSEKTMFRLSGEGFSLMTAGTETTATTLTVITYYLLSKPEILRRLTEELEGVDPGNLSWTELEKKSYLWAIINEGLRLTYGISPRTPRVARDEHLVYQKGDWNYVVPKGTPIGMSAAIQHHLEDIFPNSEDFVPERWLGRGGERNQGLERYMVSFNRGSRQCLGMNLALCELYLMTAAVTLRVLPSAKLYETTVADVKYDFDYTTYQISKKAKGVRIVVAPL